MWLSDYARDKRIRTISINVRKRTKQPPEHIKALYAIWKNVSGYVNNPFAPQSFNFKTLIIKIKSKIFYLLPKTTEIYEETKTSCKLSTTIGTSAPTQKNLSLMFVKGCA